MGSHSTVVVRGVNKQKLRLRAAAVSLRGTHQCHVEGRRLNEARVLSPELRVGNVHLCVSLHICRPFDRHRAGCPRVDLNKRSCCCHVLDGLCTKSRLLQPVPVVFLSVSARWCGAVSEAFTPLVKKKKKKKLLLWNAALFYSVKRIKINHSPTEHRQKDNWINQNDINHAFQSLLSFFFFFCWEQTVLQVFSSADSEGGRKLKAEKWQNATAYILNTVTQTGASWRFRLCFHALSFLPFSCLPASSAVGWLPWRSVVTTVLALRADRCLQLLQITEQRGKEEGGMKAWRWWVVAEVKVSNFNFCLQKWGLFAVF